ncbi:hypothetical protein [Lactiplantibacillus plantarum]|uniref:hypothetical protein n=1 Tax=Lactiplantibacillus plantarum TaxID=1590 RepID=UPI0008FB4013|nr:hypothetical protein [Lactiplantibacillus plantarum]APB84666.1 hypothetical protein BL295_02040 [Lactiplantibacillus plantarum]UQK33340.1 hypothetical protein MKM38_09760 [Lactiplantibacillus plantarum]
MITKIVQLVAASDNADMGIKAGDKYYPQVGADCVVGLDKKITDGQQTYTEATINTAGLMSAADKQKLDSIDTGPLPSVRLKDATTGAIYLLTVSSGEIKITKESDEV